MKNIENMRAVSYNIQWREVVQQNEAPLLWHTRIAEENFWQSRKIPQSLTYHANVSIVRKIV